MNKSTHAIEFKKQNNLTDAEYVLYDFIVTKIREYSPDGLGYIEFSNSSLAEIIG